jgi:hypothetical protein
LSRREEGKKILYAAVQIDGPKWGDSSPKCFATCQVQDSISLDRNGKLFVQPTMSENDAHDIAD